MNITTRSGLVGFLLALSALNVPTASATSSQPSLPTDAAPTIEGRLSKLSAAIRQRESVLPENSTMPADDVVARAAWGNGGGRGFVNGGGFRNGGGWVNGGGFRNGGGWFNGFRNGGGFVNW